ncbi:MAG: hypothetical protein L3J36_02455 [Rhodobacteraceae bacterium]|nr:hypothetical protein [Paracoccaceae bacterium]
MSIFIAAFSVWLAGRCTPIINGPESVTLPCGGAGGGQLTEAVLIVAARIGFGIAAILLAATLFLSHFIQCNSNEEV